jgi:hypothetical protein
MRAQLMAQQRQPQFHGLAVSRAHARRHSVGDDGASIAMRLRPDDRAAVVHDEEPRQQLQGIMHAAHLAHGQPKRPQNRKDLRLRDRESLQSFISQSWEFGASGSMATAADSQGGMFTGSFSVSPGTFVYQMADTGLEALATISSTKFI